MYFEAIIKSGTDHKRRKLLIMANDFNELLKLLRRAYGDDLKRIVFDAEKNKNTEEETNDC